MFRREAHRRALAVLEALDGGILANPAVILGGVEALLADGGAPK